MCKGEEIVFLESVAMLKLMMMMQNIGSARLPNSPLTNLSLFDTASCSKSFTAAAIALLVEDEEKFPTIQWNTKVSDVLPDNFVLADENLTQIMSQSKIS